MKYSFNLHETNTEQGRSSTPKDEVEWVPLRDHPAFTSAARAAPESTPAPVTRNLLAWDGASRLYFWDSENLCLHRISIRLGEPEPTSVLAAVPSKVTLSLKLSFVFLFLLLFGCWESERT